MNSEWPLVKVGDVVEITSSKRIKRAEYVESGVPFFRSKEVIERSKGNDISTELFITEDQYKEIKKKFGAPEAGDILLTSVGTLGVPYQVKSSDRFYFKDGNLTWFRRFNESLDSEFIFYWLCSPQAQQKLNEISIGSTQRALTIVALKSLEMPLPPKETQLGIVKILRNIGNKLAVNRQINQTLEQIAQALFKSWFVDFDPVKAKIDVLEAGGSEEEALLAAMQVISSKNAEELAAFEVEKPEEYAQLRATAALFPAAMMESELGEIPRGWGVGCLGDLLHFNPRRTLKKGTVAPYLDMKNVPTSGHLADEIVEREMGSGTKFINGDTLLARITPCLENGKTAYVDFLEKDQVGWGSTEYIVIRPKSKYAESLGYFIARNEIFRNHAIQSMTGTSGRQRASAKVLEDLPWVIYPKEIIKFFDKVAGGYLKLAKIYGDESKQLAELRDTLLPKLLSGELDVSKLAEPIVAEA